MKTKFITLLSICIISIENLLSQAVTVNLSIIWTECQCVYNSDSLVSYPMMKITYTNNSNNNYYFRKFSHDINGLEYQGCYELLQFGGIDSTWNYVEYFKQMESKRLFEHQNYIVNIELPYLYYGYWYTELSKSYDTINTQIKPDINCVISNINNCINKYVFNNEDNADNETVFYTSSDVTEYAIIENNDKQFLFLKAGETNEELYNLTSYYIVKGTYTFLIKNDHFKNYVINNIDCGGITDTISLPEKVGEYKLYSGKFTSNSVTVKFE